MKTNTTLGRIALAALCAFTLQAGTARASIAYGSINNFDTVNDTGHECHGFEIEIEDCHSTDITYTYNYNHYGAPRIEQDDTDPLHPKCRIRWESKKNANGTWAAYTAIPNGTINPTDGHQFTNPNVNFGGEHFGAGFHAGVGAIRYNWLIDNGSGALVHGGAVQVATPVFTFYPPVAGAAGQVQAVIAPPEPAEPPVKEFGPAVWVKEIKTTTHNNTKIKLRELVSDDPADENEKNWANGEPDEVEMEWRILQKRTSDPDGGTNGKLAGAPENLPNGDEVVTRRYEFFKYTGPLDAESGEAIADAVDADGLHGSGMAIYNHHMVGGEWVEVTEDMSTFEVVGDFTGSQMAAVDVDAAVGLIEHVSEGMENTVYAARTLVIEGAWPAISVLDGALPMGMTFDEVTGILSGTPEESGTFQFRITASDFVNPDVEKNYTLRIAAAGDALPPAALLDTSAYPAGSGITTGDGSFAIDESVTVTATAEPGFTFLNWSENGVVVSSNSSHTLTMEVNHSLIANFAPARSISTSALPLAGGTTTGDGSFSDGDTVTVAATANVGYTFTNWTEGGLVVSASASFTFTAGSDRNLVANFSLMGGDRIISVGANPLLGGNVSGGGTVVDGANVTVTATAHANYRFSNWTEGGAVVSTSSTYAFVAAADRSLVANFTQKGGGIQDPLTIVVSASPPEGGTVESDSPSYEVGDGADVQADANPGYTFVNWTEDGVVVSTDWKYEFDITESRNLVANFVSAGNVIITLSATPPEGGEVGGGGSKVIGAPVTALATAAAGYHFSHWSEDGNEVNTDKDYQFTATNSRALVAHFIMIPATGMHETENENEMEFEWPETSDGWVLQESTDLSTWVNSTRPINLSGGKKHVRVNMLNVPGVFFRLVRP
jgi:Divergent InlB B-repeat domain/Putative Ig domain